MSTKSQARIQRAGSDVNKYNSVGVESRNGSVLTLKQNQVNESGERSRKISNSSQGFNSSHSHSAASDASNGHDLRVEDKKIIGEYVHLLEKSKALFNGLRELPQYGHKSNQWQAYFGRTFDIYTKLWKFQQEHRQTLENGYGLKRWQIGDIASKIGQLYYHYYLRTSESNYLNEAFSFYQAIQLRGYYSKVNLEENSDLMVKKLRFYARYIVVCLLLRKTQQVKDLIREFGRQIDDYVKTYDPSDQLDWQLAKNEINDFVEADTLLNVENPDKNGVIITLTNRIAAQEVPVIGPHSLISSLDDFSKMHLKNSLSLQEILIVGNCENQIKFSELSLDMFRMLQACEREPQKSSQEINNNLIKNVNKENKPDAGNIQSNSQSIVQRDNSHKYLLYKPSFSQFYTYMATAFKDMPAHGVLMLYISADACDSSAKNINDPAYDTGGVRTSLRRENGHTTHHEVYASRKSTQSKEVHCIYPGDLTPFLRKPLLLIIDSPSSSSFKSIQNRFGQPFVALLSPSRLPSIFESDKNQHGNLFTLFMTSPLFAFCYICSVTHIKLDTYEQCEFHLKQVFIEIARLFYKSKGLDNSFVQYGVDDFLRLFMFRYVFCYCSLKLHMAFKGAEYYPSSHPQLTAEITENRDLHRMILELASILNVRMLFKEVETSE